ncbi:MAG: AbrB/MazE/SpoVT family DNA-binding domain-containing protein [Oligoflexales bacterium]|nr:AbrB/MazE/SpoVT family DNA-binding domain-containing protein [Oligoflexales bacterium]
MRLKKVYKSKLAANGQIVIPKELRDSLGLRPGDIITIQSDEIDGHVMQIVIQRSRVTFTSLVGLLPSTDKRDSYSKDLKNLDNEEMK